MFASDFTATSIRSTVIVITTHYDSLVVACCFKQSALSTRTFAVQFIGANIFLFLQRYNLTMLFIGGLLGAHAYFRSIQEHDVLT